MRYPYGDDFDPPAPMADVKITTNLASTADFPVKKAPVKTIRALLDTGSEISVVPQRIVSEIEDELGDKLPYGFRYIQTVNGYSYKKTCSLQVLQGEHPCFNDESKINFIVGEGENAILGRNFLEAYSLFFDGPSGEWGPVKRC